MLSIHVLHSLAHTLSRAFFMFSNWLPVSHVCSTHWLSVIAVTTICCGRGGSREVAVLRVILHNQLMSEALMAPDLRILAMNGGLALVDQLCRSGRARSLDHGGAGA